MSAMNASSIRSRTSTPIKAITTPISTRSLPPVPPSSEIYDPLPKAILRHRLLYNVFAISALSTWILSAIWGGWQRGSLRAIGLSAWCYNWFQPSTLSIALLWWLFGAVPIIVIRKLHITATPTISTSPQQTLQLQLNQLRSWRECIILLASSVLFAILHVFMSFALETAGHGNPKLGLWAQSKKHPYHINGRFVYIIMSQFTMGLFFWLRDVLKDRFTVTLLRGPANKLSTNTILSFILPSIVSMVILAALSISSSTIVFGISRMLFFPLIYRIPILHTILRPFTAHFLRPTYTIRFLYTHSHIILRAYFLNFTTALVWDIGSSLFDVASAFPLKTTNLTKDPLLALVSGTLSLDRYLQLHAFHELTLIASGDSPDAKARRGTIYYDTKHSPTMWSTLARQSLTLLDADYQLLLRRGKPAPPTPPPPPPTVVPVQSKSGEPSTPLLHKAIYKASRSSPFQVLADSLSSEGVVTQALTHTTDDVIGVSEILKAAANIMPSPKMLFSPKAAIKDSANKGSVNNGDSTAGPSADASSSTVVQEKAKADILSTSIAQMKEVYALAMFVYHGSWWKKSVFVSWWTRERVNKAAIRSLPNKELDCMIVQVMASLVAHSLEEDTLGQVQRDIPRVLELFSSFLTALEEYQTQLNALQPPMSPEDQVKLSRDEYAMRETVLAEIGLANEWLSELNDVLRSGITLIIHTFGERLSAFKFPPQTAKKLQGFADYMT